MIIHYIVEENIFVVIVHLLLVLKKYQNVILTNLITKKAQRH